MERTYYVANYVAMYSFTCTLSAEAQTDTIGYSRSGSHPRHCTEVPMHLGANMRKSWQDTSPNMVGRCYFITLALTTQKTFGAIVADVELIVTDDDTMHIEGTARCAADTDPAQDIAWCYRN